MSNRMNEGTPRKHRTVLLRAGAAGVAAGTMLAGCGRHECLADCVAEPWPPPIQDSGAAAVPDSASEDASSDVAVDAGQTIPDAAQDG